VIIGGVLAMSSYVLEKNHNRKDIIFWIIKNAAEVSAIILILIFK
jgi:hypothetical protein